MLDKCAAPRLMGAREPPCPLAEALNARIWKPSLILIGGVPHTEKEVTLHSTATMSITTIPTSSDPKRPLSDLVPESLFVILFARSYTEANNFQWGLYLHQDADRRGTKYHADNSTGKWIPHHGTAKGAHKSEIRFLLVLYESPTLIQPRDRGYRNSSKQKTKGSTSSSE